MRGRELRKKKKIIQKNQRSKSQDDKVQEIRNKPNSEIRTITNKRKKKDETRDVRHKKRTNEYGQRRQKKEDMRKDRIGYKSIRKHQQRNATTRDMEQQ